MQRLLWSVIDIILISCRSSAIAAARIEISYYCNRKIHSRESGGETFPVATSAPKILCLWKLEWSRSNGNTDNAAGLASCYWALLASLQYSSTQTTGPALMHGSPANKPLVPHTFPEFDSHFAVATHCGSQRTRQVQDASAQNATLKASKNPGQSCHDLFWLSACWQLLVFAWRSPIWACETRNERQASRPAKVRGFSLDGSQSNRPNEKLKEVS